MSIDRPTDRAEIVELLHRYSWALLDKDWATWKACFTDDAHVDYSTAGGIVGTAAEGAAWLEPTMAMFEVAVSQSSNAVVSFEGDDVASARSMYRMLMKIGGADGAAATFMEAQGEYHDRFARTAEGWRLAGRVEKLLYVR